MDAPDEMVEAVAQAIHASDYPLSAARAVLSVPALAEVIARDAKVREIVGEPFGVVLDRAIALGRIAALYPEAGK